MTSSLFLSFSLAQSVKRETSLSYQAELMRMWAISTRVNKPENDDAEIVEPIELAASA
jgi:hypothetical protein